jgi:hypothetical protein
VKIAVAIPTHDSIPFMFAYDLASLTAYTAANLPDEGSLGIQAVTGTYVHAARNELMEVVLEQGADYVLWLDSDMRFPREAFFRLLSHREDVVGINYAKRGIPTDFVAIKRMGEPGEKCETRDDSTGLEEVEAMGMGCVLIRTAVLKRLPDPNLIPWFQNVHLGGGRWMGEDVHFFDLLRATGVKLYVDHDLSVACSHLGQFEYRCMHVAATREEAGA